MTQQLFFSDFPCCMFIVLIVPSGLSSLPNYTSLSFSYAKPAVSAPSVESTRGEEQPAGLKVLQLVYGVRSICSTSDSVMSQHSRSELSSLECAIGGQITGADPGCLFQLASMVVMKHEKNS